MTKFMLRFTRRWLLTYEEKLLGFSGSYWTRQTRLYWSHEFAARRAVILTLSPGYEDVKVIDTHVKVIEKDD